MKIATNERNFLLGASSSRHESKWVPVTRRDLRHKAPEQHCCGYYLNARLRPAPAVVLAASSLPRTRTGRGAARGRNLRQSRRQCLQGFAARLVPKDAGGCGRCPPSLALVLIRRQKRGRFQHCGGWAAAKAGHIELNVLARVPVCSWGLGRGHGTGHRTGCPPYRLMRPSGKHEELPAVRAPSRATILSDRRRRDGAMCIGIGGVCVLACAPWP